MFWKPLRMYQQLWEMDNLQMIYLLNTIYFPQQTVTLPESKHGLTLLKLVEYGLTNQNGAQIFLSAKLWQQTWNSFSPNGSK